MANIIKSARKYPVRTAIAASLLTVAGWLGSYFWSPQERELTARTYQTAKRYWADHRRDGDCSNHLYTALGFPPWLVHYPNGFPEEANLARVGAIADSAGTRMGIRGTILRRVALEDAKKQINYHLKRARLHSQIHHDVLEKSIAEGRADLVRLYLNLFLEDMERDLGTARRTAKAVNAEGEFGPQIREVRENLGTKYADMEDTERRQLLESLWKAHYRAYVNPEKAEEALKPVEELVGEIFMSE